MSTQTISFLQTFGLTLLVMIAGLLILALGAFLFVRHWQKRTREDLDQIRKLLRELTSQYNSLNVATQEYTPSDAAPFGALAAELVRQQNALDAILQQLHKRYAGIQEDVRNIDPKEWTGWVRLPYEWFSIRQRVQDLRKQEQQAGYTLEEARKTIQKINEQGWEVAIQARQVLADNRALVSILSGLYNADIRDPDLETSLKDARECEDWLSTRVPVYFLSGDQASVLAEADKESVTQVFSMVLQARAGVDELMSKAKSWETGFNSLTRTIADLVSGYRELSPQFSELESNPVNPIEWDQSRQVLAGLRFQIEGLSASNRTRTTEQVAADLETAIELSQRQNQLGIHFEQVKKQYQQLLELIDQPEIRQAEAWIRQAQKSVEQMQEYSPENWDRSDAVEELAEDLKQLKERYRAVGLSDPTATVKETELPQLLEHAHALSQQFQALSLRTSSAQARHGEIKQTEREAREKLSTVRALLNQAASLASSNPELSKTATPEIKQLRESVEQTASEFDRPDEGDIDKKSHRCTSLIKKVEGAATRWLDQITQNLHEKVTVLDQATIQLQEIARLDDPAILEARRLLSRVNVVELSAKSPSKSFTFAETIAEMKKRNDEWQLCIAASRMLEEIRAPVIERYSQAEQYRTQASQWLNQAVALIPEGREWPATSQRLTSERQQFYSLEEQWHSLKDKSIKAIDLVSALADLGSKYQGLSAKLGQTVETAQQDQNRIKELEDRFEESCKLWEYQIRANAGNALVRDSITVLLNDAEIELEAIRRRYQRDGLPYNQVLQQLRSLCQKVDSAEAEYDQSHVIDINGELQTL